MRLVPFEASLGSEMATDLVYAHPLIDGQPKALAVDLYLPPEGEEPAPVVVWLGSGGFEKGTHDHAGHRALARWLTRSGVALATPACRVAATAADLTPLTQAKRAPLEKAVFPGVSPRLYSDAALASTEDLADFLRWLDIRAGRYGVRRDVVLAGSSLGAAIMLNLITVAPHLGIAFPTPAGVCSFSGGCAWPQLLVPGRCPVFALHNPKDVEMSIAPLRDMARRDDSFELFEAFGQDHGSLKAVPYESRQESVQRLLKLTRRWSGAADPSAMHAPSQF